MPAMRIPARRRALRPASDPDLEAHALVTKKRLSDYQAD